MSIFSKIFKKENTKNEATYINGNLSYNYLLIDNKKVLSVLDIYFYKTDGVHFSLQIADDYKIESISKFASILKKGKNYEFVFHRDDLEKISAYLTADNYKRKFSSVPGFFYFSTTDGIYIPSSKGNFIISRIELSSEDFAKSFEPFGKITRNGKSYKITFTEKGKQFLKKSYGFKYPITHYTFEPKEYTFLCFILRDMMKNITPNGYFIEHGPNITPCQYIIRG